MELAAVIGGVVSLVSAGVAVWQARQARKSAWKVASLNLQIAALDREADQFRADVAALLRAIVSDRPGPHGMALDTASAASVLLCNPRAGSRVQAVVHAIRTALVEEKGMVLAMGEMEEVAREVLGTINAERARLLQERRRMRVWPWRRSGVGD